MRILWRPTFLPSRVYDTAVFSLIEPDKFLCQAVANFLRGGNVNQEATLHDIRDPAIQPSEFAEPCDDALARGAEHRSGDEHLER
jgi:hypothetical protein